MKRRLNRMVSILLSGMMLVSLFPGAAWAEEGMPEITNLPTEQFGQQKQNSISEMSDYLDSTAVESEQTATGEESIQTTAVEGDYTYEVIEGAVTITKYSGAGGDVTIPGTLGGLPVTKIGYGAFYECSSLTNITLPESLISMGSYAFAYCSNLMSISLPEGLTSIGFAAFDECNSLMSISLPVSLNSIGKSAFYGCKSLISISIPESCTSMGSWSFSDCSSLTTIILPKSLTSIGDGVFSGCGGLTSISLPESVTSIGKSAFSRCSSLTTIILPENLTSIGDGVFYSCSSLTSIQFNSAKTSIVDENDGYITIPDGTTIIGYEPSTAKDYATKNGNPFQLIGETATLQSIAITTSAAKWSYNIGEDLDLTGLVVTGTYSDGTTKIETITAENVNGFDSSKAASNQVLTITLNGKTTAFTIQIIESEDPVAGDFTAFLGQDPAGSYYEYNATDLSNAYLAYQIKPTLPSAKMYQQFLNSKCRIVALKDLTKGYMDYNAAATASLKAQMKGEAFDINAYLGSSDAKKFVETVENVKIVDKDGNIS